jgi:hypothetical protein
MKVYNQAGLREIALGAAKAILRNQGRKPESLAYTVGLAVLDDLTRQYQYKDRYCAIWYSGANANQIKLFRREWNHWAADMRMRNKLDERNEA